MSDHVNFCTRDVCLFDLKQWIPEFDIDDTKQKLLCFRETLAIHLKNNRTTETKPVGGYCISIERIGPEGRQFLVNVQSSMNIDGSFGGSSVIGSVTERLHCLEEKRTEYIHKENGLHEKIFIMGLEDKLYHVEITSSCPCKTVSDSKDLPICSNNKLLSEAANVLLMRYLAISNFQGTLLFKSITIDGDLAACEYKCIPAEVMEFDNCKLNIYTIKRRLEKESGALNNVTTLLTTEGRILKHDWHEVPYKLQVNPIVDKTLTERIEKFMAPLRERWVDDIEVLSKYLDMKYCKVTQHEEYLNRHPEVKHLISDYTQAILIAVKPVNTLDFTMQYFKAYSEEKYSTIRYADVKLGENQEDESMSQE